ncbi:sigma-70 family RNA polymerase sigma factor [Ilumatobacter sp.]|uniref:RNA polymerase sigma factor n=1 Tax=Ilumatobacter sp. TaxID=1967498 RepID=UPI0032983A55
MSSLSAEHPTAALNVAATIGDLELFVETTSFETFYRERRDAVVRAVALAIGDLEQAADSTDEAMISAYQRWSKVSALDQPAGWVYRVAVNHSRSRFRRVARKARYNLSFVTDHHDDTPFANGIGDSDLLRALHELPLARRSVVVLRVLLEFSEHECAEALGIRPGTAKSRLHRGLTQLRQSVPHLSPDLTSDRPSHRSPNEGPHDHA